MWLSTLSILLILVSCTESDVNKTKTVRNKHESLIYLSKYGYNPCSNSSKKLVCSVDHSSMLRKFQERHGLKMTRILDASTVRQMNRPRCGNADVRAATLGDWKWPRSSLTWSLRSYPQQISKARATAIMHEAFNTWLAHIPLQIKEVCSTCSADFKIDVGRYNQKCDGGSFDGPGCTLAHAFTPENGTIHFDSDEQWTEVFNGSGTNFSLVAVHKIGHALGLDHNNNRKSIMYPGYRVFPRGSMLPDHDRRSIQAMYGASKSGGGGGSSCDGSKCGCHNSYCWAYADATHTQKGDWWCYTQMKGIVGKQSMWQQYINHADCFWDQTCGSCRQYKGNVEQNREVC